MADPVRNFAITTVATAPSPASSGTTLEPDDATLFPDPDVDGPFNVVVWPEATQPIATNAEIVRVTALAVGVWTIDREQEATDARAILVGDQVMLGPTAKTITDLDVGQHRVTVDLNAADIHGLDTPLLVVPAPGAGKGLIGMGGSLSIYTFGTRPFFGEGQSINYGPPLSNIAPTLFNLSAVDDDRVRSDQGWDFEDTTTIADIENVGLYLMQNSPASGFTGGPILTSQVGAGGSGYAAGDTGSVLQAIAGDMDSYEVLTVDGGGAVLTYTLTPSSPPNTGAYYVGERVTEKGGSQPGTGDDQFTVDVLTVDPGDGSLRFDLLYRVVDLA